MKLASHESGANMDQNQSKSLHSRITNRCDDSERILRTLLIRRLHDRPPVVFLHPVSRLLEEFLEIPQKILFVWFVDVWQQ